MYNISMPHAPRAFVPAPNQHSWWTGDPQTLPYWTKEQDAPSIVVVRNLLSRENCQKLVDCFERNKDVTHKEGEEFWVGRFIFSSNLPAHEIEAQRIMQQIRHYSNLTLQNEFGPSKMLFSDTAQLVRWHEGLELPPHTDNIEPDGSPNSTPHRVYSSIMYLNDEYEGGETYYPGLGVRFKPEAGTLVLFGAGPEYVHGVTPIIKGLRYTYAGWFTHDPKMEDPTARIIY